MNDKLKSFSVSLRDVLINDSLSIYHKLRNIVLAIVCAGVIFSSLISVFIYDSVMSVLSNVICSGVMLGMLYASAVLKKSDMFSVVMLAVTDIAVFPMMYIYNGGYESGVVIWYTLAMVFPWLIFRGEKAFYMYLLSVCSVLLCIVYQVFYPERIITPVNEAATAFDYIQSIVIVTLVLGIAFRYQSALYEKQRSINEEKDAELRRAVDELKRETSAKSSFLAQMSHEIRTPINAVLGMDEMILRDSRDPAVTEYADNIRRAGQSLLSIINDILDFSKIESGRMEIVPVNYDIYDAADYCRQLVEIRAREKNLDFITNISEGMPRVLYGDEVRIRQIIVNLLTNAVKYTSHGKIELNMSFEMDGEREDGIILICSVSDTGKGIDSESLEHLFDSFVCVDERDNRNIEGTGLGLAITRQLCDLMNGSISVDSEKGRGSVFTVAVPQKVVSFKTEKKKSPKIPRKNGSVYAPDAKILVVDDVKMNIDVFKGLLKKTGASIDAAYSGVECLGLMQKNSYDIVFMDHLMPEMDGVETLKRLREASAEKGQNINVPVIALTANALSGAEEEYISYGFSDYLSKPVKGAELENMLIRHLPPELILPEDSPRKDSSLSEENDGTAFAPKALSFLDIQAGLMYCSGDDALLLKILRLFCECSKSERLNRLFSERDWDGYLTCLYKIKCDAASIGASAVTAAADRLALSLGSGNTEYVIKNHSTFIKEYEMTVREIYKILI